MSTEQHKRAVEHFMEVMRTGDFDVVMDLMTDDAHWTVPGDLAFSGKHPKESMKALLESMASEFSGPISWEVTSMIAEDDKVAAEAVSSLETNSGRQYRNRYHILFTFRDGKISDLVEYCDTKHIHDVFLS